LAETGKREEKVKRKERKDAWGKEEDLKSLKRGRNRFGGGPWDTGGGFKKTKKGKGRAEASANAEEVEEKVRRRGRNTGVVENGKTIKDRLRKKIDKKWSGKFRGGAN